MRSRTQRISVLLLQRRQNYLWQRDQVCVLQRNWRSELGLVTEKLLLVVAYLLDTDGKYKFNYKWFNFPNSMHKLTGSYMYILNSQWGEKRKSKNKKVLQTILKWNFGALKWSTMLVVLSYAVKKDNESSFFICRRVYTAIINLRILPSASYLLIYRTSLFLELVYSKRWSSRLTWFQKVWYVIWDIFEWEQIIVHVV